jgi:hypothetical protein
MTEAELTAFAESWIAFMKAPENSEEYKDLFWVFDREYDLMEKEPVEIWRLILKVLSLNNSNKIQEVLSAGPLEDLLAKHGSNMIDRVESEAKSNPLFAQLLGGVWQNSMTDEVWARVQAVWNRSGWDGIV